MEFKYAKGSKMTIEEAASKNEAAMEAYIKEVKEKARIEAEEKARKKLEDMEKAGFFHSADEMIDYIMSGKRMVYVYDDYEWMQLNPKEYGSGIDGDFVVHHYFSCNEHGCPEGWMYKRMSVEAFKEWARECEARRDQGSPFINEFFHKEQE